MLKKKSLSTCLFIFISFLSHGQTIKYPYPVQYFNTDVEGANVKMAYMDLKPATANGQTVILFHGKNFNGFYWKQVIEFFSGAGYRVIAPDQIGWGLSTKPNAKYTFEMLARNNKLLLDSLQIDKVILLGHSMGGMLATRFALMYPEKTSKLILEDPLGLEDYKKFVPYQSIEQEYKKEQSVTYKSIKKYHQGYYPVWKPEYEIYVKTQAEPLKNKDFASVAYVNALTYQMIFEQPVLYEFENLKVPTLLIVGSLDRTVLGKYLLNKQQQNLHGNFAALAKAAGEKIKDSKVVILPGIGHIPHIQNINLFKSTVLQFLKSRN
jgi:pimeloyl-ACP methyl ester carboxylesterase